MSSNSNIDDAAQLLIWYKDPSKFFENVFNMKPYPYQAKIMRHLPENPKRMLFMAAGGTGKTKLLACIALWLTTVYPKFIGRPYTVIIISGSQDQAKYLYEYCKFAIQDSKFLSNMVEGEPLISITMFKDRSKILAVPNSLKAIQGKHEDCVIIDEASLAGDFIIRDSYRIVSTSDRDMIILSGTPMEYFGLFVEMWESESKYPMWERHHWSAKDCTGITEEKWIEAQSLPEDMFTIFWEGLPYAKKGALVPTGEIKEAVKDVPKFLPDKDNEVIGGLDWGWRHATALVLVQRVKEMVRVLCVEAWYREDFKDMHDRIVQICKDYNVSRLYADAEDIGENQRLSEKGLNIIPVAFNQNKVQMQSHMRIVFHQNGIKIPEEYNELVRQLRKYNWDTKEDDDIVIALMLALNGITEEADNIYIEVI